MKKFKLGQAVDHPGNGFGIITSDPKIDNKYMNGETMVFVTYCANYGGALPAERIVWEDVEDLKHLSDRKFLEMLRVQLVLETGRLMEPRRVQTTDEILTQGMVAAGLSKASKQAEEFFRGLIQC